MIINLTQHTATADQVAAGVVDAMNPDYLKKVLTFDVIPSKSDLQDRANSILKRLNTLDLDVKTVMLGGAPFFMPVLQDTLTKAGIQCVYSFSLRVSKDLPNGKKISVFNHIGFVTV